MRLIKLIESTARKQKHALMLSHNDKWGHVLTFIYSDGRMPSSFTFGDDEELAQEYTINLLVSADGKKAAPYRDSDFPADEQTQLCQEIDEMLTKCTLIPTFQEVMGMFNNRDRLVNPNKLH